MNDKETQGSDLRFSLCASVPPARAVNTYAYDSMNMLSEMTQPRHEIYLYDGEDERVATVTYTNALTSLWRYTLRDQGHHVLRTITDTFINGAHSFQQTGDYVYRTGGLLAAITPLGAAEARKHFHLDHLGSAVLITDDSSQRLSLHKYLPFGADAPGSDADGEHMEFTGHERDLAGTDTGALYYMHARYYNPNMGRFLSVDPTLDQKEAVGDPRAWNRYSYVRNNPLRAVDPDGRDVFVVITNNDVGDTHVNKYPGGPKVSGQVRETVPAYRVVMMNESGAVNTDFAVSRDTNATGSARWVRGRYGKRQETPPGSYFGHFKTSLSLGDVLALSDKPGKDSIVTPDSYTKSYVYIHVGAGCSEGCFLVTPGSHDITQFLTATHKMLAQDAAAGKGDTIHVVVQPRNTRECSSDRCEP